MEVVTTIDGTSATVAIEGNLTVATAPALEAALEGLPEEVVDVVLDLAELGYVASAGLRVIVAKEKKVRQNGGALCLKNPNDDVMEVLDMTGLVDILRIER